MKLREVRNIFSELSGILPADRIKTDEPMSRHTTFRAGGNAGYFVMPASVCELQKVLNIIKNHGADYYIIGNGSNLLVSDNGFEGVIIRYTTDGCIDITERDGKLHVVAASDVMLSKLAMEVAKKGATGFEFAAGIPGTLGGAVVMNAGAYDGEIKDCIVYADILKDDGTLVRYEKEALELGYRSSILQREGGIVIGAGFEFEKGSSEAALKRISELAALRREKQPLEYPSAGSTFKRPEGNYAGKLIMEAGLKGYSIGGAQVSEKHCGFIINKNNATAKDIYKLINAVRDKVYAEYGIMLETEVKLIGNFDVV